MRLGLGLNLAQRRGGLGPNVVSNGTFNDATGWTLAAGHTVSGGKLNMAATSTSSSTSSIPITTVGRSYRVTYTISNFVNGSARISLGGVTTPIRSANGTYAETITATVAAVSLGVQNVAATTNLSVDDLTVQEIL